MPLLPHDKERRQFFVEKYASLQSEASREVERDVLGHDVGLNGFTTIEQARALGDFLELTAVSCLLDIGGGRGWPGFELARSSKCRLSSTDIPFNALLEAKEKLAGGELRPDTAVIAADGRELPFRASSFDAIVHADVFC